MSRAAQQKYHLNHFWSDLDHQRPKRRVNKYGWDGPGDKKLMVRYCWGRDGRYSNKTLFVKPAPNIFSFIMGVFQSVSWIKAWFCQYIIRNAFCPENSIYFKWVGLWIVLSKMNLTIFNAFYCFYKYSI